MDFDEAPTLKNLAQLDEAGYGGDTDIHADFFGARSRAEESDRREWAMQVLAELCEG